MLSSSTVGLLSAAGASSRLFDPSAASFSGTAAHGWGSKRRDDNRRLRTTGKGSATGSAARLHRLRVGLRNAGSTEANASQPCRCAGEKPHEIRMLAPLPTARAALPNTFLGNAWPSLVRRSCSTPHCTNLSALSYCRQAEALMNSLQ